MNSAHPIKDEVGARGTGPVIGSPGCFPKRQDTVCADVLSRSLNGQVLTGMETVFAASTTRLAAHVGYLETRYGWQFERDDKVVGCSDGRIPTITTYRLAPDVIEHAMQRGAAAWCAAVKVARRAKRAHAEQAQVLAKKLNQARAARMRQVHPGQTGLFDAAAP